MWTKRQEQLAAGSWLATVSAMPTELSDERIELLTNARNSYMKTLFPHLDAETKKEQDAKTEEHEALEGFAKTAMRIDLKPVFRAQIAHRKAMQHRRSLPRVRKG